MAHSYNNVTGTWSAALPDEPAAKPTPEAQMNISAEEIERIDKQIVRLREQQARHIQMLRQATDSLRAQCEVAREIIRAHEQENPVGS